jgi:hypothetical protein
MISKLLALDEFLTRDLVRPFYWIASAFTLVLTASGLLIAFATMVQSVVVGLLLLLVSLTLGGALFLGVRLAAESVIAVSRMHERFIGGNPGDPIPPP